MAVTAHYSQERLPPTSCCRPAPSCNLSDHEVDAIRATLPKRDITGSSDRRLPRSSRLHAGNWVHRTGRSSAAVGGEYSYFHQPKFLKPRLTTVILLVLLPQMGSRSSRRWRRSRPGLGPRRTRRQRDRRRSQLHGYRHRFSRSTKQSTLDETYHRRTGVERTHESVKDFDPEHGCA